MKFALPLETTGPVGVGWAEEEDVLVLLDEEDELDVDEEDGDSVVEDSIEEEEEVWILLEDVPLELKELKIRALEEDEVADVVMRLDCEVVVVLAFNCASVLRLDELLDVVNAAVLFFT